MTSVSSLRRRARKLGYRFTKSNWRKGTIDNVGGYMLIEIDRNICVAGQQYDLDISYIEDFIQQQELEEAADQ